jgi:Matrixin/Putative peptidoglycan binding domain
MTAKLNVHFGISSQYPFSTFITASLLGMSLVTGGCADDGSGGGAEPQREAAGLVDDTASARGAAESITLEKAERYLRQFGYLGKETKASDPKASEARLSEGLRLYQQIHRLPVDGTLNQATRLQMAKPRCAHPDDAMVAKYRGMTDDGPSTSFVRSTQVWSNRAISYRHTNYTLDMLPVEIEGVHADAFEAWQDANPALSFTKITSGSGGDILVSFEPQFHQHGADTVDFGGNVLGHAFYPAANLGGDVHYNDSWTWSALGIGGQNLMSVALHEIGHSLGLAHSLDPDAVMWPTDNGLTYLTSDDILGINAHYPPPAPSLTNSNGACYGDNSAQWTAQPNTTRYELYRSTTASFSSQVLVYSGGDTYQSVNVLPGGWYLRVRACNAYVCGPYSASQFAAYVNTCM